MTAVTHLVTVVDVRDDVADARQLSLSVRHEAVLGDGRHLLLLADRGWTTRVVGGGDAWSHASADEIEATARVVVGPDEPFGGRSQQDMDADHWAHLADVLRQQGIAVLAGELQELRHDVVLSDRVLARIEARRHAGG